MYSDTIGKWRDIHRADSFDTHDWVSHRVAGQHNLFLLCCGCQFGREAMLGCGPRDDKAVKYPLATHNYQVMVALSTTIQMLRDRNKI